MGVYVCMCVCRGEGRDIRTGVGGGREAGGWAGGGGRSQLPHTSLYVVQYVLTYLRSRNHSIRVQAVGKEKGRVSGDSATKKNRRSCRHFIQVGAYCTYVRAYVAGSRPHEARHTEPPSPTAGVGRGVGGGPPSPTAGRGVGAWPATSEAPSTAVGEVGSAPKHKCVKSGVPVWHRPCCAKGVIAGCAIERRALERRFGAAAVLAPSDTSTNT